MPKPLTHAEHLAEYTLERLAEGLASNAGQSGRELAEAQRADVCIALQRVLGYLAGDRYEARLLALLQGAGAVLHGDSHTYGAAARSIAEARFCAAADVQSRPTEQVSA